MENIRRPWLSWKAIGGVEPFVEQYEIALRLRTIIGPTPDYRDDHVIRVSLGPDYPILSAPRVQMLTRPPPFHPNWWPSGQWCYGTWWVYESLGAHIVRMIQTLQYDPEITQGADRANGKASDWYNANRSRGWFPCDNTPLPDPTGAPAESQKTRKFQIRLPGNDTEVPRQDEQAIVVCTNRQCAQKLRVPAGRTGQVKCPKCGSIVFVRT
jgi:ubiquitin-protein ligase